MHEFAVQDNDTVLGVFVVQTIRYPSSAIRYRWRRLHPSQNKTLEIVIRLLLQMLQDLMRGIWAKAVIKLAGCILRLGMAKVIRLEFTTMLWYLYLKGCEGN